MAPRRELVTYPGGGSRASDVPTRVAPAGGGPRRDRGVRAGARRRRASCRSSATRRERRRHRRRRRLPPAAAARDAALGARAAAGDRAHRRSQRALSAQAAGRGLAPPCLVQIGSSARVPRRSIRSLLGRAVDLERVPLIVNVGPLGLSSRAPLFFALSASGAATQSVSVASNLTSMWPASSPLMLKPSFVLRAAGRLVDVTSSRGAPISVGGTSMVILMRRPAPSLKSTRTSQSPSPHSTRN